MAQETTPHDRRDPVQGHDGGTAVPLDDGPAQPPSPRAVAGMGTLLALVLAGLALAMVRAWPEAGRLPSPGTLLALVLLAGALGSAVHAGTSFADFVGNRRLGSSWLWWYLLKPFTGGALALLAWLVAGHVPTDTAGVHTAVGLAGLVGLFSKQATDKLGELCTVLLRVREDRGDGRRRDKLGGAG
jgi:hypothetical protein